MSSWRQKKTSTKKKKKYDKKNYVDAKKKKKQMKSIKRYATLEHRIYNATKKISIVRGLAKEFYF